MWYWNIAIRKHHLWSKMIRQKRPGVELTDLTGVGLEA